MSLQIAGEAAGFEWVVKRPDPEYPCLELFLCHDGQWDNFFCATFTEGRARALARTCGGRAQKQFNLSSPSGPGTKTENPWTSTLSSMS